MDDRDSKGGEHGTRIGTTFHGASDQGSSIFAAVKCQNSQVSNQISRSKIDPFGPDGPTQVPVC
jgi:hypothetical protein